MATVLMKIRASESGPTGSLNPTRGTLNNHEWQGPRVEAAGESGRTGTTAIMKMTSPWLVGARHSSSGTGVHLAGGARGVGDET
ncbi:hypothetical protein BN2476_930045 [Paraburkholderia piptadeniae]|uniref:Uncharacterized protein n=1 Tax=Paraburkholderia piptadeniae TaxID=1701573 RepID=A0A1N7STD6_9BURK|nr:hypothetical protein BN2476_930045 [Paraburkholderia piptadeniae]